MPLNDHKDKQTATQSLCLNCGFCCNGSLHNWTNLRSIEVEIVQEAGITVITLPEGSPAFLQPCAAFTEPICRIYSNRPGACRSFECKLYKSLQSETITFETALVYIQKAKELIAELQAQMEEPDKSLSLERQVRYQWLNLGPPPQAEAILAELTCLLEDQWGAKWSLQEQEKNQRARRRKV